MSDLISRQDAIDAFDGVKVDKRYCTEYEIGYNDGIDFAVSKLSVLPTADVVERKRGEWIDFSMSIKGIPTEACGECGEWSYGMGKNFCPNCGAKMRKEVKKND